jgi:MFS family permease
MTVPLSRNRNYRVLWGSQALSEFGFQASTIAFPLLVLALTGSAAASGLVLGTVAATQLAAGLPGGALVDRWNRKKVMLGCEAAQVLAAASLVAALALDAATVPHLMAVAAVFGACAALFQPAEDACLPSLVPDEQVATAVAMNSARGSLGQLAGTAAGGALFAVGRVVPFVADMLTHVVAFTGLLFLRVPAREVQPEPMRRLGREMAQGVRWAWQQRRIRVTAFCAVVLNLFFTAFYIVVIVLAQQRGVPPGRIGIMAAMLGAGGILGALLAPYLQRVLSPYLSIAGVFWVLTALTATSVLVENAYVMGAVFAGMALLPPTANATIISRQLLLTPDELRGRLSGAVGLVVGVAAAVGPVLGGFLVEAVSGDRAILTCATGMAAITLLVTVNPTLHRLGRDEVPEDSGTAVPAS